MYQNVSLHGTASCWVDINHVSRIASSFSSLKTSVFVQAQIHQCDHHHHSSTSPAQAPLTTTADRECGCSSPDSCPPRETSGKSPAITASLKEGLGSMHTWQYLGYISGWQTITDRQPLQAALEKHVLGGTGPAQASCCPASGVQRMRGGFSRMQVASTA